MFGKGSLRVTFLAALRFPWEVSSCLDCSGQRTRALRSRQGSCQSLGQPGQQIGGMFGDQWVNLGWIGWSYWNAIWRGLQPMIQRLVNRMYEVLDLPSIRTAWTVAFLGEFDRFWHQITTVLYCHHRKRFESNQPQDIAFASPLNGHDWEVTRGQAIYNLMLIGFTWICNTSNKIKWLQAMCGAGDASAGCLRRRGARGAELPSLGVQKVTWKLLSIYLSISFYYLSAGRKKIFEPHSKSFDIQGSFSNTYTILVYFVVVNLEHWPAIHLNYDINYQVNCLSKWTCFRKDLTSIACCHCNSSTVEPFGWK